jgi:arylsulfatase A-like enzyme
MEKTHSTKVETVSAKNAIERRDIRHPVCLLLASIILILPVFSNADTEVAGRPNFIILMSDNQSSDHLGSYGDQVVKTPTIDAIAEQGVRFVNAFASAPSCTPARASMLTGQDIWRLEEGANLHGILPVKFEVYPDLMEEAGYHVGHQGKGWGPGNWKESGRSRNPAGDKYRSFEEFYAEKEAGQPFMYWFNSRNPHRPYQEDGGKKAGIDTSKIEVPPYLPDTPETRGDIANYYAEVQDFDAEVADVLSKLETAGALENTIVIVASDNGWQMPRGLANLYLMGTKVPLIISMPERFGVERVIDDFVSLNDLAPTFLELAGIDVPKAMTAKSLVSILESGNSGIIEPDRDFIVTARERHAYVRFDGGGYGGRAIQTSDFLYIHNFEADHWPAGDPPLYGDVDAHMMEFDCPTKLHIMLNRDTEQGRLFFDLAFAKRPEVEFYDLRTDPYQLVNVASDPKYAEARKTMARRLNDVLTETDDPRVVGGEMKWIDAMYNAKRDFSPIPSDKNRKLLGLEKQYFYALPKQQD